MLINDKLVFQDVVGSTSGRLNFGNNNLVCNLVQASRIDIDVIRSEQFLDCTRVGTQHCTLHAVNLFTDPVDEAELDSDGLVNLFSESQQAVANILVLQVADKLAQTARALMTRS